MDWPTAQQTVLIGGGAVSVGGCCTHRRSIGHQAQDSVDVVERSLFGWSMVTLLKRDLSKMRGNVYDFPMSTVYGAEETAPSAVLLDNGLEVCATSRLRHQQISKRRF
jgi:hypothetical protein